MFKLFRRRKKRPKITDWEKVRPPTNYLPFGFPFVTCRPMCPGSGCPPCADYHCQPAVSGTCGPGTVFYPTACLPTYACYPTIPPGCVPVPRAPGR